MCVPSVVRRFLLPGLLGAVLGAVLLVGAAHLPPAHADDGDVEITAALINAGQGRSDASHEWVLLTNLGDDAVDLSGWTLTDNAGSDPLDDVGNIVLPPRASLLIAAACAALIEAPAADADLVLADAAIGRGLSNRGDLLELRDAAGGLIDAVSWGNVDAHGQRPAPDAGEPLRFGDAPIPLSRSGGNPALLSLQIADAEDGGRMVELVNACEWQQPLDGWSITVGDQQTDLAGLNAPPNGTLAAPIEPPAAAARIELRSPDGQVVDATDWSPPDSTDAQSEEEDAAATAAQTAPDAPAPTIRPPIRITEFMPRPLPDQPEWVELINDGAERVDLSGWQIGDARSSRELWGAIEPGQRVVFAAGQLPAAEGEIRLLNGRIGNGLNNDGDILRLIAPDGTVAVSVEYGGPELPVPAAGASLALTPRVWVVNSSPSPGGDAVVPALEAAAPALQPIERSPAPPAPIGELRASEGINPWMVVSAGLGGLLIALLLRRWLPNQAEQEEPPPPDEPPPYHLDLPEHQLADEPSPDDLDAAPTRSHPWTEDDEDQQ